jgi:hypothetical protein
VVEILVFGVVAAIVFIKTYRPSRGKDNPPADPGADIRGPA